MTTAEELIKKEFPDWQDWADWGLEGTIHIMREYAKQCAQDALNRAAENADSLDWNQEELIKNTEIITP